MRTYIDIGNTSTVSVIISEHELLNLLGAFNQIKGIRKRDPSNTYSNPVIRQMRGDALIRIEVEEGDHETERNL